MVQVDAEVHAQLGRVENNIAALGHRISGVERAMLRPPAQPFFMREMRAGVVNAAGDDLVLGFGGPHSGRTWMVMGVTIGGVTYATAAAGTALVVVSAATPLNAANLGTGFVYDQAPSLPLPATYSRGQIPLKANERLFIIIVGGTIAQSYTAGATIEQYEDGPRTQVAEL